MALKIFLIITLALLNLINQGCAVFRSSVKPIYGKEDKCGCRVPPEDVFIAAGVDLKIAQSTISKLIIGGIEYRTDPKVITIASKAMIDERIKGYIRCSQIKRLGLTVEQISYFEQLSYVLSTKPTVEELTKWRKANPPPPEPLDKPETCEIGKNWRAIVLSSIGVIGSGLAYYLSNDAIKNDLSDYDSDAYFQAGTIEAAASERESIENRITWYKRGRLTSVAGLLVSSYFLIKYSTE